ncbi:WecB/TagA/CpsF family glycosyltransferase [Thermomicrobiaceae bacterium CFH 74404]|uniref:WecB/TagA/CpsF family glycosyltransferase n=1 Tax=Thermalbibacter longus TaxID=2951981 RepID=A0AA41WGB0_9BACT|nr:WecB/TagA/CpsF family glycosyltransferase [Thermalbibacter longus]MCM8749525.1 WecB/TagA/CpsF family glycosyltransferase [Thermalbibacter longus]
MTTQPADPGVQARSGERPRLPAHARILGLPVHDLTLPELVDRVRAWLRAEPDRLHQVVTLNPEMVMAARHLPEFRETIEAADLVTADGIGIVLAARVLGRPLRERVTGVDLVEALAATGEPELALFLLGAAPGVAERAARRLEARYPGCRITGTWAGSPGPEGSAESLARIAEARPAVLLVAYGAPAQELWIARHRRELEQAGVVVAVGVGGTFDYLSGAVPRAPRALRRLGLEWLYRLIRQPWRWRRQRALPQFALLVVREWVARRLGGRK